MQQLTPLKPFLQKGIRDFLTSEKQKLPTNYTEKTFNHLLEFCSHGKMIRGLLFLFIVLKGEVENIDALNLFMPIAIALELVHAGLLIHDDIMDRSFLRRGKESTFQVFGNESPFNQESEKIHYGYSMAICVGDLAFFLAQKSILFLNHKGIQTQTAHLFALEEWNHVCLSQMTDIHFSAIGYEKEISYQAILDLYKGKTARYTFSLPLKMAGIFLGFEDSLNDLLYDLGIHLGILFQITDDYLDLFCDSNSMGKNGGQDILEKKKTLYLVSLFKKFSPQEAQYFNKISEKESVLMEEIHWVRDQLEEKNILEEIEKQKILLIIEIKKILIELKEFPYIIEIITNLLNFILERDV